MKLHEDKEAFKKLINIVSIYYNYDQAIIEKDYYVMYILEEIVKQYSDIVFKGGTSLSKAHKLTKRFSEDIDLTLETHPGDSKRKRIKHTLVDLIKKLNFEIENEDSIKGNRDFNRYLINYPKLVKGSGIKEVVQIETSYIIPGYPKEEKEVSSYIYEYLKDHNLDEEINKYDMHSFKVNVQTVERTFIDKVFAICDYKISNEIKEHSRHIYDLYKIYPLIKKDDSLLSLIKDIREKRSKHEKCYSAKDGEDINKHLKEIVDKNIYESDYNSTTKQILAYDEDISYDEAITVIDKIINSNLFIEE